MSGRSSAPLAAVTGAASGIGEVAAIEFYILDPDAIPIEIRQPVEI